MIREKLSAATVILLAFTGKNLRNFHVRKNAILLKCDWPRKSTWDEKFYDWLKKSSRLKVSQNFVKLLIEKKNSIGYP
jgi:F-box protein 39